MEIKADGWLAELFGHPVFRLDIQAGEKDLTAVLQRHSAPHAFYYAKVDCKWVDIVGQLGRAGMFVVDTNVNFELDRPSSLEAPGVSVGQFADGEAEAVLDIAGSAYQYSRFHLDPQVSDQLAHRIKREWCGNYVRKLRGDRLFVARIDGRPVGFLAALVTDSRNAVIDLVGVDKQYQRRRVGAALTQAFIEHYRPSAAALQVGTQVANVPSMRLYERLGFSMSKTQYVLHLHRS